MKAKDMNVGKIIMAVFDKKPFEIVITSKAISVDTVLFTAEAVSLERIDDTNFIRYSFEFEVDKDEEKFTDITRWEMNKQFLDIVL